MPHREDFFFEIENFCLTAEFSSTQYMMMLVIQLRLLTALVVMLH